MNGRITTLAGDGVASFTGDYGAASAGELNQPFVVAVDGNQNIFFSDRGNSALREIIAGASATPSTSKLSLLSGNNQTPLVDQLPSTPLGVKLTDSANNNLAGYPVTWSVVDAGGGLNVTASTTGGTGNASATGRPGLLPQPYRFQSRSVDIYGNQVGGSPITFTMTAGTPSSGTIFDVVDEAHTSSFTNVPGPGTWG